MDTYEDFINNLIKNGYLRESNLRPLKCRFCDSVNLKDEGHTYLDDHIIEEYNSVCKDCGKITGYWSYGHWFID